VVESDRGGDAQVQLRDDAEVERISARGIQAVGEGRIDGDPARVRNVELRPNVPLVRALQKAGDGAGGDAGLAASGHEERAEVAAVAVPVTERPHRARAAAVHVDVVDASDNGLEKHLRRVVDRHRLIEILRQNGGHERLDRLVARFDQSFGGGIGLNVLRRFLEIGEFSRAEATGADPHGGGIRVEDQAGAVDVLNLEDIGGDDLAVGGAGEEDLLEAKGRRLGNDPFHGGLFHARLEIQGGFKGAGEGLAAEIFDRTVRLSGSDGEIDGGGVADRDGDVERAVEKRSDGAVRGLARTGVAAESRRA